MLPIRLLAVGKLKEKHWQHAADHYYARLKRCYRFEEYTVKDGNAKLPAAERNNVEGESLLSALKPIDIPICLDEHGKTMTSTQFATFMDNLGIDGNRVPCFIIGGAYGLSKAVLTKARHTICLSAMTFTHEMARVILLEQLYRADAIRRGAPYHHI